MEKTRPTNITDVYREAVIDPRVRASVQCGGCEAALVEAGSSEQLALQSLWKRVKQSDWRVVGGRLVCGVCVAAEGKV